MHYVYVMVYISLAVAMQLLTGNFPVSFFAFPLNLIFAALWLFLLWMLYKEYKIAKFTRFLYSSQASILSIGLLICGCLIIGLFPQLSDAEAKMREGFPAFLREAVYRYHFYILKRDFCFKSVLYNTRMCCF